MVDISVRLLGQVEVWAGQRPLPIAGRRQRLILAMLAMRAGRTVGVPELIAAVWDEDPPETARRQVQNGVSQLRAVLGHGDEVLASHPAGYRLRVPGDRVDVGRFRAEVAEARRLAAAARASDAGRAYRRALALWRGPALDGLGGALVGRHAATLDEERLCALEECVEQELLDGQADRLVAELTELMAQHPLRERFAAALMLALYRGGRQADALQVYQRIAATLAETLGVDPGPALRARHEAILRNRPDLDPRERDGPALRPAQLPATNAQFVGREREIGVLDLRLSKHGGHPILITGSAGVGKTALAVHWAHRVAHRFPDGQFYVNLRGFDLGAAAMDPADAVRGFLDALEVRPERIPAGLDARTALYRSLLAGRRAIVVLDNARDAAQVRPLLPGSPTCQVLVTSRNQLAGLVATEGAHPLALDVLTTDEARLLLIRRLGADRVAAEPGAVDEIIVRCARLSLALTVVAARAAIPPGFPLAVLAKDLAEAQTAFDALSAEDPATDVRAVFSWSYRILGPDTARLFRLLGLHPGPDIALPAAAGLAGVPVTQAKPLLTELSRANLLTEHSPGRYALHDLLRAYAGELAHTHDTEQARHAATHRLLDHYVHTACAAAKLISPQRPPIDLPPAQPGVTLAHLTDHGQALDWFAAEHRVLLTTLDTAAREGFDSHIPPLVWFMDTYFQRRGHFQDFASTNRAELAAAHRMADRPSQSRTHRALAAALTELGPDGGAWSHFQRALRLSRRLGDTAGQAAVHTSLAWMLARQGQHARARRHARRSLDLFTAADLRGGQARALNAIGWYSALLGSYEHTVRYCRRSLAIHRELGDAFGEAGALDSLGYAHRHLGEHQRALACYEQAITLYAAIGERFGEAETLAHAGDTHADLHHTDRAREAWQRSLRILDELGHHDADEVRAKLDRLAL